MIFLEKVKVVLVGSPTTSGIGGTALVGRADALARPYPESLVANEKVANKPTV